MEHPKDIGDRSALAIAIALEGIGHAVYFRSERTRAPISSSTMEPGSQGFSAKPDGYAEASCSSKRAAVTPITRTRDL
jgi:hypothetical protein